MNSIFTGTQLSELLRALLDVSCKGMIVLIFGWTLSIVLRRKSAAARHLVWSLIIGGLLTLPVLSFLLPLWRVPILPQTALISYVKSPVPSVGDEASMSVSSISLPVEGAHPSSLRAAFVLLIWLAGLFFTLTRLIFGSVNAWQLKRNAKLITDDSWITLTRRLTLRLRIAPITLRTSPRLKMPMTCGVFRASVMLPVEADEWSEEYRRAVLSHELAHVKRRDLPTQMLSRIACAIYWFNPLVWLAASRLRTERELACDDQVLAMGTRATDYARILVDMAATLNSAQFTSTEFIGIVSSHLEGRVRAILNPAATHGDTRSLPVLLSALAIGALLLPLAAVRVATKPQPKQSQHLDHLVAEPLLAAQANSPARLNSPATSRRSNKTLEPRRWPPDENYFLEISESAPKIAAETPARQVNDFAPPADGTMRQGDGRGVGIGRGFRGQPLAAIVPQLPSVEVRSSTATISTRTSTSRSVGPTITNVVNYVVTTHSASGMHWISQ